MDYCPDCGEELSTVVKEGRDRNYCESCDKVHWLDSSPCAAVVLEKDGKALMIKRAYEPWKNHWSIPAGYMEVGEDPKDAAVRELQEETGVEVGKDDLEIIDAVDLTHPDGKEVVVIVYRAEIGKMDASFNDEVIDAEFMERSSLPEKLSSLIEEIEYFESVND